MLVIMKRKATETDMERVKEFLVDQDCDFHQSTGTDRIILGVVGDTSMIDCEQLKQISGVLDVYPIPHEDTEQIT
jgi:3-deoxy-7-phosphoheptulonate synthase